ncbi:NAD(P)/FAD-dependent oxidoreductase [Streptomyces turgidiscabies]|uniref:Pyridine nucleotide-disulfide oxidoreductase n=1 Tax=Streptomyces turgidiscabies (strain Car8) TaxID=698760 RepID=L7FFT3_STRT8|nr:MULTISPECIES: FAD-dependent oxidoreductase [Streptomyces]ELP69535.1 pyridine nucleotide-disulfide oxidoreductase [Streptomyces turgidiscabies Car8]MDX3496133.1 FAD-dependent oxidoreductase [Streptomyces turgidiscabies]GAQ75370.1 rhodocoxin reductase [Streptomyces turgidiscabies]
MSGGARLLVVGAGQAGVQVAGSARELGWDGPITLIGQERHAPYERPPLSKAFLKGEAAIESLALRTPAFYAQQQIDLVLDEHVTQLHWTGGGAGTATSASGRHWAFDRLVLATGAQPRALRIDGAGLDGVLMLRDVRDAEILARRLMNVTDLVVIGGGFVGLEVAATATAAGVRTSLVEAAPVLMNRVVSKATADVVAAAHRRAGVRILTGVRPRELRGDGGTVSAVELEDGRELPAQLVLVGVGARPRDELARAAGFRCDNGIVVDAYSLTSDGHTLAVGDCANLPDPSPAPEPAPRLRLESIDNAVEQAKAAATTLVGRARPYRSVPWFWSDQGALKLQIAGLARTDDDIVIREVARPGRTTVLRYRGEHLVAAECVNNPADFLVLRKALGLRISLPREKAVDTRLSLKKHLAAVSPQ